MLFINLSSNAFIFKLPQILLFLILSLLIALPTHRISAAVIILLLSTFAHSHVNTGLEPREASKQAMMLSLCSTINLHNGDYEEYYLLECDAV
jgi:ABC-type transport system involved in cytochrome c biogenesis permease component